LPGTKISEVTIEQWPVYIRALKWASVEKLYRLLKYTESQSIDLFNSRFAEAKGRVDVSDADLDIHITELQQRLSDKESASDTPEAEKPVGSDTPSTLFEEEAA
jgi:hypothetical protein